MACNDNSLEEVMAKALVPIEEQPYKVPDNWCWCKLGDISNIKGGKRLPKGHGLLEDKTNYPYIRVTDFEKGTINLEAIKYISEETFKKISRYIISQDDVYISIAGTIGRVGIIPEELNGGNLTENAAKITDIKMSYNQYIFYLLDSDHMQQEIKKSTVSTSQPKLALFRIVDLVVPMPPIAEQQRIVNKIGSLFSKIDKAKELIEEAREGFKNRKAAILAKTFRGELTTEWRKRKKINFVWKDGKFEDLCVLQRGFDLPKQSRNPGDIPIVSSSGIIDSHNEAKVIGPGVATGRSGSIGKVFYIEETEYWPLNTTLYCKDFKGNYPKYVYYYLSVFDFKSYSSSTAVPTLNRNNFKDVPVSIPTIEEQREIVRILDKLLEEESKIEELTKLEDQIELLKKSILAKAFRGELGTNDPNEESAMELLKEVIKKKVK